MLLMEVVSQSNQAARVIPSYVFYECLLIRRGKNYVERSC